MEKVISRFESGASLDSLERELPGTRVPSPMALVRTKEDVGRHIEALLKLHGGELGYYDYRRGDELLLVCLVLTTVWR